MPVPNDQPPTPLPHHLWFPLIQNQGLRVAVLTPAEELVRLIAYAAWQQRVNPVIDPKLMRAAQTKAADMIVHDYFGHISPVGITANENVRAAGYVLPTWYLAVGNNVESISGGWKTPEEVVQGWFDSTLGHKPHILGEGDYYRGQTQLGCGYAQATPVVERDWEVWVFLSAHPEATP